jgi:hypothetical protein
MFGFAKELRNHFGDISQISYLWNWMYITIRAFTKFIKGFTSVEGMVEMWQSCGGATAMGME